MTPGLDRAYAAAQDEEDPLRAMRAAFHIPRLPDGREATYLCGHSLGLQPKTARAIMEQELESWATRGVEGHFDSERPWVSYHEQLVSGLARLTGALPHEVVAMNSLTVNLHLMLASFYRPQGRRHKIMIEARAFSSDRYAVRSHLEHRGFDPEQSLVEIQPSSSDHIFDTDEICARIAEHNDELALIVLPGVQYLSGQCFDMQRITQCARAQGCLIGFDLAHAIGNVPLQLHDWDVDFAVWCGYKYLNAGPGAIGGCYVHERHGTDPRIPRLAGWWGHDKRSRFEMPDAFVPLSGAEGWQLSNPSIFAAAPLLASLRLFDDATMSALRAKSIRLTGYLELLLQAHLANEISVLTPSAIETRGCQLSFRIERSAPQARALHEKLMFNGCICDWREPDVVRVAPVPLYNSFKDVWHFVAVLRELCATPL
jgi:kynureninase